MNILLTLENKKIFAINCMNYPLLSNLSFFEISHLFFNHFHFVFLTSVPMTFCHTISVPAIDRPIFRNVHKLLTKQLSTKIAPALHSLKAIRQQVFDANFQTFSQLSEMISFCNQMLFIALIPLNAKLFRHNWHYLQHPFTLKTLTVFNHLFLIIANNPREYDC